MPATASGGASRRREVKKYDSDYSRFATIDYDSDNERQSLAPSLKEKLIQNSAKSKKNDADLLCEMESLVSSLSASEAASAARAAEKELQNERERLQRAMKEAKKNAEKAAKAQQVAMRAQERAKIEHEAAIENAAKARVKVEETAQAIDHGFGLVLVREATIDVDGLATVCLDGADHGQIYPIGATVPLLNVKATEGIIKARLDLLKLPMYCQIISRDHYLNEGLCFHAPNQPVDIISDAELFSRYLRLEIEHLVSIKCFSLRCFWSDFNWNSLVKLTLLNANSVELLLPFGRRFRLVLPVHQLDPNRCALLDSSCFRLGFDRLLKTIPQIHDDKSHETAVVVVQPPMSIASNEQNFDTIPLKDISKLGCATCGKVLALSAEKEPQRAPFEESEFFLEAGRPVECLRAVRFTYLNNDRISIGPSPIFPPSFLIDLSRGRKTKPARCARCQADIGLVFFDMKQPADLVLYKHRLSNTRASSIAYVASLIIDNVNDRCLRSMRLRAPGSSCLAIRVFRIDGHASPSAIHIDTENTSALSTHLLPTISLAFSDNPERNSGAPDADIELLPDDFLAFRAHLEQRRHDAENALSPSSDASPDTSFASLLGLDWHLVSVFLPIAEA